jgi:hypothetical protein
MAFLDTIRSRCTQILPNSFRNLLQHCHAFWSKECWCYSYQRAMMKIFQDIQHSKVECYVDDLAVQSQKKEDHLDDLRRVFEQLRKHKLRMNPLKCFFGLSSGKLFGFVVRKQGIELDPVKVKAIPKEPKRTERLPRKAGI